MSWYTNIKNRIHSAQTLDEYRQLLAELEDAYETHGADDSHGVKSAEYFLGTANQTVQDAGDEISGWDDAGLEETLTEIAVRIANER